MARNAQPHNSLLLIWFHHATVQGFVGKHATGSFVIGWEGKTAFFMHSSPGKYHTTGVYMTVLLTNMAEVKLGQFNAAY